MSTSFKWLHVQVTDLKTGKRRVNVKIPASLADFGMKMASKFAAAELDGIDMQQIIEALNGSGETLLVDVDDEEQGEHVEIYIE